MKIHDQQSTRFNSLWWKYYRQAQTIYQVHSPFLFEFTSQVWPSISDKIRKYKAQKANFDFLLRQSSTHVWLSSICTYYAINHLVIHKENNLSNHLSDNFIISDSIIDTTRPASFSLYETVDSHSSNPTHCKKISFHILAVLPDDENDSDELCSYVLHSDSGIILCENIHMDDQHQKQWNQIIASGEFDYSVELYNFGILFHYPTNKHPEHMTLIPWRWKPWKLKIF